MLSIKDVSATALVAYLFLAVFSILILKFVSNYVASPLKSFPGNTASSFTDIWRVLDVYRGRADITHQKLHRKYGSAVRMGPNTLSLSDPDLVNVIFRTKNPLQKAPMYNANDAMVGGQRVSNVFSTRDEDFHTFAVQPIKSCYSMTKVLDFEPSVDAVINIFTDKVDERFADGDTPCDLANYMLYYVWDTMMNVSFSRLPGFLEAGSDNKGYLSCLRSLTYYFGHVSQIPKLDEFLDKNPVVKIGPAAASWTTKFSMDAYQARLEEPPSVTDKRVDFMERFLEVKKNNPDTITDELVIMWLISNVAAGSDTTGIALMATMYYVLKDPAVHRKLREEIDNAQMKLPVSWKASQQLPYLDAVIREAWRIHPSLGLMLERIVPEDGMTLPSGQFVPGGTLVGMSGWVVNRDRGVYGPNPDQFIPDRWLKQDDESDEDFEARRSRMKRSDLTFGAGKRGCIGRYMSILETYKVIATLFAKYDMELERPDFEWKLLNQWFVYPENIPVIFKEKKPHAK